MWVAAFMAFFLSSGVDVLALGNGDRVRANATVNVRSSPAGSLIASQPNGASGTVVDGPTTASLAGVSYTWWKIDFDSGADGWVASGGLDLTAHMVSLSVSPSGSGSATGGGAYAPNAAVTLSAVPATGYVFTGWSASGLTVSTSPTYTFNIGGSVGLVANFTQSPTYAVAASVSPANGGYTAGGGNKIAGSTVSLFASPATGYSFVNWTENGSIVSSASNYVFTATGNRALVANFAAIPSSFTVSLAAQPAGAGALSGAGTYADGSAVTLTATPSAGYAFAGWSSDGVTFSTATSYSFSLHGNLSATAHFIALPAAAVVQPPTVITAGVAAVTTVSAQLAGTINPHGSAAICLFQFGVEPDFRSFSLTPVSSAGAGSADVTVTANLAGLTAGTTYYYRLIGTGTVTVQGETQSFTTTTGAIGVPLVSSGAVAALTRDSVRLKGRVDANGLPTEAWFEYGVGATYGSSTAVTRIRSGAAEVIGLATGLQPDTVYHGRIVATSAAGTSRGADITFRTPAGTGTEGNAVVVGTDGIGLRLRAGFGLAADVLQVLPEGTTVLLLGTATPSDGYLWRPVRVGATDGWVADNFLISATGIIAPSPGNLRQWRVDAGTLLAAGDTTNDNSVVLGVTVPGSPSEQFKVQFEVKPVGTGFSTVTHETGFVAGGSDAGLTVGPLSGQGYRWRVRVLDAAGNASAWVVFGASSSAAFVVDSMSFPNASFRTNPGAVFAGEPVEFVAEAGNRTGWTYEWSWGGSVRGTNSSVTETFAEAGTVAVKLVVTNVFGRRSEHSELVEIGSTDLRTAIERAAQETSDVLDRILVDAKQAANARDAFNRRIDKEKFSYIQGLILDATFEKPIDDAGEYIARRLGQGAVADKFYGKALDEVKDLVANALTDALYEPPASGRDVDIVALESTVGTLKSELAALKLQVLAAATGLSAEDSRKLAHDLRLRASGNLALGSRYGNAVNLPVVFLELLEIDENSVSMVAAEYLFTAGKTSGLAALALVTGGSGNAVLQSAEKIEGYISDASEARQALGRDGELVMLSATAVDQAPDMARWVAFNLRSGLQAVMTAAPVAPPVGTLQIEHIADGWLGDYGLMARWFTREAYASASIRNTGTAAADFQVEAVFTRRMTTTQLFSVSFYGLAERHHDITTATCSPLKRLQPGESAVVKIPFTDAVGGVIPRGPISYRLLAWTANGCYQPATFEGKFGTTLVDAAGVAHDHDDLPETELVASPLAAEWRAVPGSSEAKLILTVRNPFGEGVPANLELALPYGATVLDGAGGKIMEEKIHWELDLGVERGTERVVRLQLPATATAPLMATCAVYDRVGGRWITFQVAPKTVTIDRSTPPSAALADDFDDGVIEPARWSYAGNTVTESGGVMRVLTTVTDAGGTLNSVPIAFNPTLPVTISRRVFLHRGIPGGVYMAGFGLDFGALQTAWVKYADINWSGTIPPTTYLERHGFFLTRNNGNPHIESASPNVSSMIPAIWDTWFDEKLVYDPVSGLLSYFIDGDKKMDYNVGAVPTGGPSTLSLHFDCWGWYTGHEHLFDDLVVSQEVPPAIPLFTLQPQDTTGTEGDTITLEAAAIGQPAPSYQWRKNGVDLPGENTPRLTLANIGVADIGIYTVVATNSAGSTVSERAALSVAALSTARLVWPDGATAPGPVIRGNAAVSWRPVSGATGYQLQLTAVGGVHVENIYLGAGVTSWSLPIDVHYWGVRTWRVDLTAFRSNDSSVATGYFTVDHTPVLQGLDSVSPGPALSNNVPEIRWQGSDLSNVIYLVHFEKPADHGGFEDTADGTNFKVRPYCLSPNSSYFVTITTQWNGHHLGSATGFFVSGPGNFDVTTSALPAAGGVVMGAGNYTTGDVPVVRAVPNAGYAFERWSGSDTRSEDTITFPVDGPKSFTAHFIPVLGFPLWQSQMFVGAAATNPTVSGPDADPDHDGLSNLAEYALGLDPVSSSDSRALKTGLVSGNWSFTYTRPADRADIIYRVEWSSDLRIWNATPAARISSSAGMETWCAAVSAASEPTCFFRLVMTR